MVKSEGRFLEKWGKRSENNYVCRIDRWKNNNVQKPMKLHRRRGDWSMSTNHIRQGFYVKKPWMNTHGKST